MKTMILLIALIWFSQPQGNNNFRELTVKVQNIKKIQGSLKIGIFDQEEQFLKETRFAADLKVMNNTLIYTFKGLSPGFYALSVFHDENENGELDSNWLGIPSEPYGFSNDAKGTFGPPDFQDCLVEVTENFKEIIINL